MRDGDTCYILKFTCVRVRLGRTYFAGVGSKSSRLPGPWSTRPDRLSGRPAAALGPETAEGARTSQQKGWGRGGRQDEGPRPPAPRGLCRAALAGSGAGPCRAGGTLGTSFLPALNQPRLISLAPDVPSRLFNDNCFLLICQPFIRVFPGERQRQKISNLFTRSTNYPN